MAEAKWVTLDQFPKYEISDQGEVYNSQRRQIMRVSYNNYGHAKITLADSIGRRHTRSVALLVAEAFVESPNLLCDHIAMLDGNLKHVEAANLVWRPRWFAWKYTHQLKVDQPVYYKNLYIGNVDTGDTYGSVMEAGMTEGLLFDDIWESTYKGSRTYPYGHRFEVLDRV